MRLVEPTVPGDSLRREFSGNFFDPSRVYKGMPDTLISSCARLSDDELEARLKFLVTRERQAAVHFIVHLMEADRRRLYAEAGFPSLFAYCVQELRLSEGAAYKRIRAARAADKFPAVLEELASGRLHLAAACLLAPCLTPENHPALLEQARGKSKREVEFLVASIDPEGEKRDYTWRIKPASGGGARVSFDADKGLLEKITRARQVLFHKHPAGRLKDIFHEALESLLAQKDWDRKQSVRRRETPAALARNGSLQATRRIPLWVRQQVWRRDEGRCSFKTPDGRRCEGRGGIEFDHIIPYALGGPSNKPENIRLLCRAHNQLAAIKTFAGKGEKAGDP